MDLKSLEYMEERAKKARAIVQKIDQLTKESLQMVKAEKVIFYSFHQNINIETKEPIFMQSLRNAFVELAAKEIQRLEQELAEL